MGLIAAALSTPSLDAALAAEASDAIADMDALYDFRTEPVVPRVHRVFRPEILRVQPEGNVTIVEQADGLVVVDAGGAPAAGERVVARIKELSPLPVKVLVYTHYHGDHNLGAPAFRKAWPGLRIVSSVRTRDNMMGSPMDYVKTYGKDFAGAVPLFTKLADDEKRPEEERRGWARAAGDAATLGRAYSSAKPVPADTLVADRLSIPDPEAPVELLFLGKGHTDGDLVAWLPRQRVLASGDLVIHPFPYGFNVFPADWLAVLRRIKGFDFARLIPGHGAVQADAAYLDRMITLVEDVRGRVAALAAEGLELPEVRKRLDLSAEAEAFSEGSAWNRNLFRQWFAFPFVHAAWREAEGLPIVPGGKVE